MNRKFNKLAKGLAQSVLRDTKGPFLLSVLVAALCSVLVGQARAQIFTTLHSFTALAVVNGVDTGTNSDGAPFFSGLVLSSNTLYGTAGYGGPTGNGTVFKINTDGSGFTVLHSFNGVDGSGPFAVGGLVLSGSVLYGSTDFGGGSDNGTIFKVISDGTGFATLHIFNGSDGSQPESGVILSGNTLHGTTSGSSSVVFSLNTDGTSFSSFPAGLLGVPVMLLNNSLYGGETFNSASWIFKINLDGTGLTNIYDFTPLNSTNSDGGYPNGLISLGNTLYGSAQLGGSAGKGTVFRLNADGTGFRTLHTFTGVDGYQPLGLLVVSGNTLYGTTTYDGSSGNGTVFKLNTDGTAFKTLYNFTAPYSTGTNSDGAQPERGVVLSGSTLYGITSAGGAFGNGTIFSLSIPPELTLTPSGPNLVLSWPTNFTGFTLQSTSNLNSQVWTTNLTSPIVLNGQYTVTNPISGTQQFFRLSQ